MTIFDQVAEKDSKAFPGPWCFDSRLPTRDPRPAVITCFNKNGDEYIHGDLNSVGDAEFIAFARTALPEMARRLQRAMDQLSCTDDHRIGHAILMDELEKPIEEGK